MYNISSTFRQQLNNGNRNYGVQINITLLDGTALTVYNSNIWAGGLDFEDATSSDNEFQIGSAIINKVSIALNNMYDTYSDYDFDGATVVVYIGLIINGTMSETIRRGTYIVNSSSGYNTQRITLECYDYMAKLDKPYALINTVYPATLRTIVQNICTSLSITLNNSNFYNSTYVVNVRPADDALTCRQVIAFVAQIACSFAKFDEYGRLDFAWYNMDSGATPTHSFTGLYSISAGLEPIVITGVRVTEEFPETESIKKGTELYGNEGYVIDISGNDLIQQGQAYTVAELIGTRCVNATPFYKISASVLSDPSVEVGDTANITDTKGNVLFFPITKVTFSPDSSMGVYCGAVDAVPKSATRYTELTKALVKAREISESHISEYDLAMQMLTELMSESFGIFKTEEIQQDGSSIYYLHNKPNIEDSDTLWKMTANGLAVSQDGGTTWVAGIDSSGNAVVNVLSAVGVSADWIHTGSITVGDAFQADIDTGTVIISGDNVFIGDVSATEALSQLSGALTITLSNEMQGIPVDSNGDYATFPNVSTQIRVLYGSQDVTMSCILTYAESLVTGTLTNNGSVYTYTASALNADTGYVAFTVEYNTGSGTLRNSKRFNLYKVYAGAPGPSGQGTPARMYYLESDAVVLKQGQDKEYIPSTLTFNAYYRDGNEETRHEYAGLFKVEITTDGTTWETVEYPIVNKTYTTYTPDADNIAGIRCTLYSSADIDTTYYALSAGDYDTYIADDDNAMFYLAEDNVIITGGDQIDVQSVAVVVDVSALSQDDVFNILTNNSLNQGLYRVGSTVYINAEYIASGVIRSKSGNTYWNLEQGGILSIKEGEINLGNGKFVVTSAGALTATGANVSGTITATSLTLTGNATVPYSKVSNTPNLTVYVQKDGTIGSTPSSTTTGFKVSSAGLLQASNAIIYGTIYASAGTIGGCQIQNGVLQVANANITGVAYSKVSGTPNLTVYVQKDGTIGSTPANGATGFKVSSAGLLQASNAIIWGTVYASNGSFSGAVTATTLTLGSSSASYLYVRGNSSSFFRIPIEYFGLTDGEYIQMSSGGFFAKTSASNVWIGGYNTANEGWVASNDDIIDGIFMKNGNYLSSLKASSVNFQLLSGDLSRYITISRSGITLHYDYDANQSVDVTMNRNGFRVDGQKSRRVTTQDYGKRLLYCYETPTPMFGDIGEGIIGPDGLSYVQIDSTFSETISTIQYQVFLQAYGDGRCYVQERHGTYFVVAGTPDMAFGWEIKAKQSDFDQLRLERDMGEADMEQEDYADIAMRHIDEINNERIGA